MKDWGIIYQNICLYRISMAVLYRGGYKKRFRRVFCLIKGKSVVELCFGDTLLAAMCRKSGMAWKGYDMNPRFVKRALRQGFQAEVADVEFKLFSDKADTCIISGSLYHFGEKAGELIDNMLVIAPRVIISEPVKNISAGKRFSAKIAAAVSSAGKGPVQFRFSRASICALMENLKNKHNFTFTIDDKNGRDIIITIKK